MTSAGSSGGAPSPVLAAEIELVERGGVRVVAVAGELDISNVGALEDATFELPNEALGLVLDLSRANYIDSATVGLLAKLQRSLQRRGQALRIVCLPGSSARRVLELTGFERATPLDDTRDAAVGSIRRDVPLRD
jgi:anti-anti-sigma factor